MSDQESAPVTIKEANDWHNLEQNFQGNVRGEDVPDIEHKCLSVCQKYLSGIWSELTVDDIEVKRLTGGMSNINYHCKALHSKAKESNETQEVVIRYYGVKYDWSLSPIPDNDRLADGVIGLLVSEKGLGAQVYGLFNEGQIQKYYPHRHFTEDDLNEPCLLRQLASKLARFHAMSPPLAKDSPIYETLLTSSAKKLKESPEKWRKLFESYECKALLDCDMSSEVKWLLELIPTFESSIVFSHNDFRFPNQMISDDNEVVLGDFEMSSYDCRGFDFATLFSNMDSNKEVIKEFITEYVREGNRIFGKSYSENAINSVEHILKEAKQFSLMFFLCLSNLLLHNYVWHLPIDEKTCMAVSENAMQKYLATKKLLAQQKII